MAALTNQQIINFCNNNPDKITFCVVVGAGAPQPISIKDLINFVKLVQSGQIT